MPETVTCPDCGAENPAGAAHCQRCNFPLQQQSPPVAEAAVEAEPAAEAAPADPPAAEGAPAEKPFTFDPDPRPVRRRRERPGVMQPIQMQIWLFVGAAVVLCIFYFAAQGFWNTHMTPVEGASNTQQQRADEARKVLEKDSTNVAARIELGNVLYDTGNWSEAIVHYRAADRLDPHRATTVVDMGVCYYNLGSFSAAESLFVHALTIDPKQLFALFNLGIVAESREDWEAAIVYFHRVMALNPPEPMKPILEQHLQAAMAKAGKTAPPLGGP
jgi:cytochrome c-type biogenesis protein CcmH/NrfG